MLYCAGRDEHLARKIRYEDTMTWGIFLESRLDFLWIINRRFNIRLGAAYRYIAGGRGDTTVTYDSAYDSGPINDRAGAGYSALDTGLKFVVKF